MAERAVANAGLPAVTAVVINHDGGRGVERCLQALGASRLALKAVVVVDNASTDGSRERLVRLYPYIKMVALAENRGPAAARNVGLTCAATDFVLLVDDDVYLRPETLERLVRVQGATGAAVITPRVLLYPAGGVQCDGGRAHFLGMMMLNHAQQAPTHAAPAAPTCVGAVISACLLVERRRVLEAGGFDALYFIYFEDLEMGLRLRALGQELVCAADALVDHDRGAGTVGLSFRGRGAYAPRRAFLTHRNRWLTLLIHYRLRALVALAPALLAYEAVSLVFFASRGVLPEWHRSWRWLFAHRVQIRMRRECMRVRRVRNEIDLVEAGELPLAPGLLDSQGTAVLVGLLSACTNAWFRLVQVLLRSPRRARAYASGHVPEGSCTRAMRMNISNQGSGGVDNLTLQRHL